LTDPYYFDFISFSQYQTINREIINDPPYVFVEKQPIPAKQDDDDGSLQQFADILVKRESSLKNNMLAAEHGRRVGASILDRFNEIYGETDIALPQWDFQKGDTLHAGTNEQAAS
jgi:hypothetical protein